MKKIFTFLIAASLILGVSSCKTNTKSQECNKAQTEQCANENKGCAGEQGEECTGNKDQDHECCEGDPEKPCCKDGEKPENANN
jgi:hypothetical protein